MKIIVKVLEYVDSLTKSPLYRNSAYILLSSVVNGFLGFSFWVIAARFYSQGQVGVATAVISLMAITIAFSRLGLDQSLIRFFPSGDKKLILSTSILMVTSLSVTFAVVTLLFIDYLSPELAFLRSNAVIYLVLLAGGSATLITSNALLAARNAKNYFVQNLITNLRIIFVVLLISLGTIGIIGSYAGAFAIAVLYSIIILRNAGIKLSMKIDFKYLRNSIAYSAGNYFTSFLSDLPLQIIPIIIIGILGPNDSALYYVSYVLVMFILAIPNAFSTSLLVEGSHGENLHQAIVKSIVGSYTLVIPAILALIVLAPTLLGMLGTEYLGAIDLLDLMLLSTPFMVLTSIYSSVLRVQKKMGSLIVLAAIVASIMLSTGYVFLLSFGLLGVAYAWILGNAVGSCFILFVISRGRIKQPSVSV